jgi:hypothetical protein
MRSWLPVIFVFTGLGSSISSAQATKLSDPFTRYLSGLKANQPEVSLVRFARDCGLNITTAKSRYAQLPGDSWIPVKNLSKALEDQETDFYSTVAVWYMADRILIERWGMELDTGSESRMFYCLQDRKIDLAEEADWSIPIGGEAKSHAPRKSEKRWKIGEPGWAPKERVWDDLKLPSSLLQ